MIDIESDVFQAVATSVRDAFSDITVSGEYEETFSKLPAMTILEADNRILEEMRTVEIENAVSVMYEINVYSNKASGRKSEAKAIIKVADARMKELGFTRTFLEQIPNFNDSRIFRLTARYEAVVGEGTTTGTYLIYQN